MKEHAERECIVCGKKFIPYNSLQLSCSDKCKKIRASEQKKEYEARRRESTEYYHLPKKSRRQRKPKNHTPIEDMARELGISYAEAQKLNTLAKLKEGKL